jgi:hypothetical protein
MRQVRLWCSAFFLWWFVFYNVERLHAPINIASFIYVLAPAAALPMVLCRQAQRVPLPYLLVPLVPVVVVAKAWLGYPVVGAYLPITITELCALWLSVVLARQLGRSVEQFRSEVACAVMGHLDDRSQAFRDTQTEIYREVCRARLYDRPLALLAVRATDESVKVSVGRFMRQLERDMVREYIHAKIGEFLCSQTKKCDLVAHRDGHFVALLPETSRENAEKVAGRIAAEGKESLGLELRVGLSTFPDEEITLVGLLERAEFQMRGRGSHSASPSTANEAASTGRPMEGRPVPQPALGEDDSQSRKAPGTFLKAIPFPVDGRAPEDGTPPRAPR